jgi:transposase-like protein
MKSKYSEAFIEQALVKVFSRGDRTVQSVAEELNVNYHALKRWMKRKAVNKLVSEIKEKRPQDWRAEEQLVALHETHGLLGEALHAWCREHGLFAHHLASWKVAFCADGKGSVPGARELRTLKDENTQLKRELSRKEKALAEAAALLILQKKFHALWEDEVK